MPTAQRNQVHVYVVGGMLPTVPFTLDTLRAELNHKGFARVTTAQSVYAPWIAYEMRRIRKEEPNAVFVLIGTEGGTTAAKWLAERAGAKGLPVAGLVLFDRGGVARSFAGDLRVVTVPNSPSAPESVAVISRFLNEAAATAPRPAVYLMESDYPYAPAPRPYLDPSPTPEWSFLFDDGTPPQPPTGAVPATAAVSRPGPIVSASQH
jgi:hypothetical protein